MVILHQENRNPLHIPANHPDLKPRDYIFALWKTEKMMQSEMTNKQILTRGLRNNNPLNIEKGNNWQGEQQPQSDRRFEEFVSLEYGLRAGFIILKKYIARPPRGYGQDTIARIISKWAPHTENATEHYINFVSAKTGILKSERLRWEDKSKLCAIVRAMAIMESGMEIPMGRIETAYELAKR